MRLGPLLRNLRVISIVSAGRIVTELPKVPFLTVITNCSGLRIMPRRRNCTPNTNSPLVTKGSIIMYTWDLRSLTNTQLVRLYRKVYERIERAFVGGLRYGVDMPTLRAVMPGMAVLVVRIRREGQS